jgi:hypothetical protein
MNKKGRPRPEGYRMVIDPREAGTEVSALRLPCQPLSP